MQGVYPHVCVYECAMKRGNSIENPSASLRPEDGQGKTGKKTMKNENRVRENPARRIDTNRYDGIG